MIRCPTSIIPTTPQDHEMGYVLDLFATGVVIGFALLFVAGITALIIIDHRVNR